MKKTAILGLMAALLAMSACMNVSTIPLGTYAQRPMLNPDDVKIYLSEKDVPGEFDKVALIYAEEVYGYTNAEDMFASMRIKAARVGANGLLLNALNSVPDNNDVSGDGRAISDKKQIKAVAIFVHKQ